MSCRSDEADNAAPPLPRVAMPTEADGNDGASHANQDAEETDSESDADVE